MIEEGQGRKRRGRNVAFHHLRLSNLAAGQEGLPQIPHRGSTLDPAGDSCPHTSCILGFTSRTTAYSPAVTLVNKDVYMHFVH